jgi:Mn2+/Fe2+ NRAMP family transporter
VSSANRAPAAKGKGAPIIPHKAPTAGTGSLEAALDREHNPVKKFLKVLGPGLVTGASDDDPSGIGTYAVAGASLGFATLWLALVTFPLMAAVQFTCAKIGMVTGRGLAGVLREHYPRPLVYATVFGLCLANSINAGADIGAIAAAINLLVPIPMVVLIVPIALFYRRFAALGFVPTDRQHVQVAGAGAAGLHRGGAVRAP